MSLFLHVTLLQTNMSLFPEQRLRKFQLDYLRNGKSGKEAFDAQKPHLEQLAKEYEAEYDRTGNWRDAFKVS